MQAISMPSNNTLKLIHYLILNSQQLFKELEGELYPHGAVMNPDFSITPYYYTTEEEFPDTQSLLNQLTTSVEKESKSGNYLITTLCYQATRTVAGVKYDILVITVFDNKTKPQTFQCLMTIDPHTNTFTVPDILDLQTGEFLGFSVE